MEMRTTRDLRKFLADTMVMVRDGKCTASDANAIAKLSSQINQSLAIEVNAAVRQGIEQGAYVENAPMRLTDDSPSAGSKTWCDQCDASVSSEDAETCRSPHCSLK